MHSRRIGISLGGTVRLRTSVRVDAESSVVKGDTKSGQSIPPRWSNDHLGPLAFSLEWVANATTTTDKNNHRNCWSLSRSTWVKQRMLHCDSSSTQQIHTDAQTCFSPNGHQDQISSHLWSKQTWMNFPNLDELSFRTVFALPNASRIVFASRICCCIHEDPWPWIRNIDYIRSITNMPNGHYPL